MPILPRAASQRAHEIGASAWKVFTNLCDHRNIVTGKCNPSHELISRQTGVEISGVSVAKKELREAGFIETRGKRDVVILVGIEEFEEVRAAYLWKIQLSEALKCGKSKDAQALLAAIFGFSKDRSVDVGIFPALSLDNPKTLRNSSEIDNAAAAAPAAASSVSLHPNAWKQEEVTEGFLAELVTRGLFSQEGVGQSWQELAFAVAQRGPGARATKGELMAFCRAKQRTGILPGTSGPFVKQSPSNVSEVKNPRCAHTCPLCHGSGMEIVPGKGARRCAGQVTTAAPADSPEEIAKLQEQYDAAQAELQGRAGSS